MKWSKLRTPVAVTFILLVVAGVLFKTGWGTLSSFGYDKIAEICPLGSLEAMIASHTLIPRALLGLFVFALIVIALGRFSAAGSAQCQLSEEFSARITSRPIPMMKTRRLLLQPPLNPKLSRARSHCLAPCRSLNRCLSPRL